MVFSIIRLTFLAILAAGMLACAEEGPQQSPNPTPRAGAVKNCSGKGRSECSNGCYWQERANVCGQYPESELTCEQRNETQCQQGSTGCTYLTASQACISAGDTRCDLRRTPEDCQAVSGGQCVWTGSCAQFTTCDVIPEANCTIANCRRVSAGGGSNVCVDPQRATQIEEQLRQQQETNNPTNMILAAAIPGVATLIGRLFGLQVQVPSDISRPYSYGQRGVPVIGGTDGNLSAGESLDDYTMLPFLASVQQSLVASQTIGNFSVCSRVTSPQQCDNQYPTCAWVTNSCVPTNTMDAFQICRGVATSSTGAVGTGGALSSEAVARCDRYRQHCTTTQYTCSPRQ